jgi:hypothetical protein
MEDVQVPRANFYRYHASTSAVAHQHIHHMELIKELDILFDALLIERLQDHVTGTVSSVASTANGLLDQSCWCAPQSDADSMRPSGVRSNGKPMCSSSITAFYSVLR